MSRLESRKIFINKQTANSYLDTRNFWRSELGEENEGDMTMKKVLFDKAELYKADINSIIPNQDYLNMDMVKKYMSGENNFVPLGILFDSGNIVLFDGHHRVAADILKGKSTITIKVLKADF